MRSGDTGWRIFVGLRMGRDGESIADNGGGNGVLDGFLSDHEAVVVERRWDRFTGENHDNWQVTHPQLVVSVVYCPLGTNQVTVALDTVVPFLSRLGSESRGANHHVP